MGRYDFETWIWLMHPNNECELNVIGVPGNLISLKRPGVFNEVEIRFFKSNSIIACRKCRGFYELVSYEIRNVK